MRPGRARRLDAQLVTTVLGSAEGRGGDGAGQGARVQPRARSPWDELIAEADTPPPVVVGAEPWDTLVYEGRVRRDGERLHRIGFVRYGEEMGARFTDTFADRQATVTETSGWILVRDDGTPVLLQARIDGRSTAPTPAVLRVITTYRGHGSPDGHHARHDPARDPLRLLRSSAVAIRRRNRMPGLPGYRHGRCRGAAGGGLLRIATVAVVCASGGLIAGGSGSIHARSTVRVVGRTVPVCAYHHLRRYPAHPGSVR